MSLFAGHKRDLEDDGQSANFKKLKSDLGALFGFGNNALLQQHNTVVSFRELAILDDKACTNLVDILKTHGYYKVKEMPPEFINACGNLYTSSKNFFAQGLPFKSSRLPERPQCGTHHHGTSSSGGSGSTTNQTTNHNIINNNSNSNNNNNNNIIINNNNNQHITIGIPNIPVIQGTHGHHGHHHASNSSSNHNNSNTNNGSGPLLTVSGSAGESETGYRRMKDRESVLFRKGYQLDEPNVRGVALDPARDIHSRFEQYFTEATKAANVILQAIIKGLGGSPELARNILPNSHEHNTLSTNVSRAFHYFDTPLHTVICPPHLDLGLLTLIPSNFPGLQVYSLCSSCGLGWESTHKALDSTDIVVLAGELLNEYAAGLLPPGLHRVVSEKPAALNFNFPFASTFSPAPTFSPVPSFTPLSPLSPAMSPALSPPPPLSPSPPSPVTPPATIAPPAKKSRSKKAAAAAAAAANNNNNNNININNNSNSPPMNVPSTASIPMTSHNHHNGPLPGEAPTEPGKIGRISLPFLLRPRPDAKIDGSLVGLRSGRYSEKSAGQYFEEEKMRRGGVASVGQY